MRTSRTAILAAAVIGAGAAPIQAAQLRLELADPGPFLRGEAVVVNVYMADLGGEVAVGFQAFLSFDSAEVTFNAGSYVPAPFGLPVIPIIVAAGEDLDMASGIDVISGQTGTSADSHLVVLAFEAVTEICVPTITFRDVYPPSRITDDLGMPIEPLELVVVGATQDCNGNEIEDACDIAEGTSRDCNANGLPDECEILSCPADFTGPGGLPDGQVNVIDLLELLAFWGLSGCADFSGPFDEPDGVVNVIDLLDLLAVWGPCP